MTLHLGNCLDVMKTMPDNCVDSIVTDPPYGLSFMGKRWDYDVPSIEIWAECLRVLKPGGHLLAFSGTRTQHRMAVRIEDAGFEIRDMLAWVYGSGFPKSLDVSKAIDKTRDDSTEGAAVGAWLKAQREARGLKQKDVAALWPSATGGLTGCVANWETLGKVPKWDQWLALKSFIGFGNEMDAEVWRLNGRKGFPGDAWQNAEIIGIKAGAMSGWNMDGTTKFVDREEKAPATDAARQWQGWGTALKPALEPITMGRKPLIGTVASNVQAYGTGGLNIDGCRVVGEGAMKWETPRGGIWATDSDSKAELVANDKGRWPANLLHDGSDEVVALFPDGGATGGRNKVGGCQFFMGGDSRESAIARPNDSGSVARFFYCAKADREDRNDGLDVPSNHPTVKPTDLMRWLCRLVTPPGGTVLDPFMGSGSTGRAAALEGFEFIGIEMDPGYLAIAESRIAASVEQRRIDTAQLDMFGERQIA